MAVFDAGRIYGRNVDTPDVITFEATGATDILQRIPVAGHVEVLAVFGFLPSSAQLGLAVVPDPAGTTTSGGYLPLGDQASGTDITLVDTKVPHFVPHGTPLFARSQGGISGTKTLTVVLRKASRILA